MKCWQRVRQFQNENSRELGTLYWWEKLVKPGINKIALQRSKEINKARREELNLLLLRQLYLTRKLVLFGYGDQLGELQAVHLLIDRWYNKESEKIQHQSRVNEFQENEKSSIYHHELHKKIVKKSSILKLQTESGLILGHTACATYLEQTVEDLLLHPGDLDLHSQQILLEEVAPVFTDNDIRMFLTTTTKEDVWKTVGNSNLNAAPGSDGIPSLAYKECCSVLGDSLTDVMMAIFNCQDLQPSMRTYGLWIQAQETKQSPP